MPAHRLNAKLFHPPNTNYRWRCTWITVLRYRKERVQEGKASSCPCSPLDFCFASLVLEHFAFAVSVEQKLGVVAGILNDEAFLF